MTVFIPQIYFLGDGICFILTLPSPHLQGSRWLEVLEDSYPTENSNSAAEISFPLEALYVPPCPTCPQQYLLSVQTWLTCCIPGSEGGGHEGKCWKVGVDDPQGNQSVSIKRKVKANKNSRLHYYEITAACAVLGQLCLSFSNSMMSCLRRGTYSSSYPLRSALHADRQYLHQVSSTDIC